MKLKDAGDKIIEVKIKDVLSKEIYSANHYASSIDISNKENGIYFVEVKTQKKKIFNVKLIKE